MPRKLPRKKYNVLRDQFPYIHLLTYISELKKILANCKTILDIGCGATSPLRFTDCEYLVGVDLNPSSIAKAKKNQTHNAYIIADAKDINRLFKENEFDACVGPDLIEHLTKKDGLKLIQSMEKIAKKKVVIFTPNGYMHQHDEKNPLEDHQSGWTAKEMEKFGFEVKGIFGPKSLRGDQHLLKGNKWITGFISEIIQFFYTKNHPETAAALLCVKNKSQLTS